MAVKFRWLIWLVLLSAAMLAKPVTAKKKRKVRTVVIDEVTRVEGKIQKPEVWYLLPRSNLNFKRIELKAKLSTKIESATKKDPF
jgi:hypothetical protein